MHRKNINKSYRNIAFSAGPGHYKDFQFEVLGNSTTEDKNAIIDLHEFWRKERKGLYNYLIKNDKFSNLFDKNQSHIKDGDLGLFIILIY
jgi:hypothetical protein